jgi:hypothetical protein
MTVREELIHELETASDEVVQALLAFLRSPQSVPLPASTDMASNPLNQSPSFFDVAKDLIGAGEGPGDLSTNPDYLQGYGQ